MTKEDLKTIEENVNVEEETDQEFGQFNFQDEVYELKYNIGAIEKIEQINGESTLSILAKNQGMIPIATLKQYFSNSCYKVGGGKISPKSATKMFDVMVNQLSYLEVNMLVVNKLKEDCGFLFPDN